MPSTQVFFLLAATLALGAPNFASFETFGTDVLVERWHMSVANANKISSLPQGSCVLLMPLVGAVYDAVADRSHRVRGAIVGLVLFSASWMSLTHGLGPRHLTPILATVGIALGASLFFGGTWPSVPLLVDRAHLGTAYGFMTAFQNLVLSAALLGEGAPPASNVTHPEGVFRASERLFVGRPTATSARTYVGKLKDATDSFKDVGILLSTLSGVSALLGLVVLRVMDERRRKDLRLSAGPASPTRAGAVYVALNG